MHRMLVRKLCYLYLLTELFYCGIRLAIQSCELIETELCFWIHIFFQNCVENPFMPQDLLFVLDPTEFRFDSPGK